MKKLFISFRIYLSKLGIRRILFMLLGNILIGVGIAFYRHAALGNDPFSAMTLSLCAKTPLNFGSFIVLFNLCLFVFQFFSGKKYIGLGTLANWTLLGYVADICMYLDTRFLSIPDTYPVRLLLLVIALLITSFGVSLYQTSDSGISPYDYLSLGLSERTPIPYFFCRIACDGTAVVVTYMAGGLLGIGTLLTMLLLGPCIHFFTNTVSRKLIYGANKSSIIVTDPS